MTIEVRYYSKSGNIKKIAVERFIRKCKRYADLTGLTPTILDDLISKVFVEAPDKSDGKRKQTIHISYDLVGILPKLNNPIHEEMA
ncbi:MAG: DUF4368 domain-containing protein [Sporolactobacillus sp.]|jgi:hypothetical protein|nr:DUF4368 domain-containing protein [Sporolactobacillus sp.]